jgi:hypothetical protein
MSNIATICPAVYGGRACCPSRKVVSVMKKSGAGSGFSNSPSKMMREHRVVGKLLAQQVRLGHVDKVVLHVEVLDSQCKTANQHMSSDIQDHLCGC